RVSDLRRTDERRGRLVDNLSPARALRPIDAALLEPPAQLVLVPRPEAVGGEGLDEAQPPPRRGEVDLLAAEGDTSGVEHLTSRLRDELLDALHRVAVVRVRLVPLEHRELGVVLERHTLVAEVL